MTKPILILFLMSTLILGTITPYSAFADEDDDDKNTKFKKHKVHTGDGPPPNGLGKVGDLYIDSSDTDNLIIYKKTGKKTWTNLGSFQGEDGSQGPPGEKGDKGDAGETGPPGEQGLPGQDGQNCWDLNGNDIKDLPDEDTNRDGRVDVLDCKGSKGDKGDKGDTGETGPQGEQGPPGSAGSTPTTLIRFNDPVILNPEQRIGEVVRCSAGERVTGGGVWVSDGPRENMQIINNLTLNGIDWVVLARNNGLVNEPITIQVMAVCLRV